MGSKEMVVQLKPGWQQCPRDLYVEAVASPLSSCLPPSSSPIPHRHRQTLQRTSSLSLLLCYKPMAWIVPLWGRVCPRCAGPTGSLAPSHIAPGPLREHWVGGQEWARAAEGWDQACPSLLSCNPRSRALGEPACCELAAL